MTPDPRRVAVAAPEAGQRLQPPPRRVPEVVAPSAPAGAPDAPPAPTTAAVGAPQPSSSDAPHGGKVVSGHVSIPGPGAPPPKSSTSRTAPPPPAQPATSKGRQLRRPRPRTVVLGVVAAFALFAVTSLLWGYAQFRSVARIDLSHVLATENGTNYLIVGSDSRDGIDPDDPNSAAILGDDSAGGPQRSDTILILRVTSSGATMLSVPRDLYVTIAGTGERQRINAAFNGGPERLIATLQQQLGLPIHHYLEIDFVSFRDLVDAVGGITIDFPHPATDAHSGLYVEQSGEVTLDGSQALAYVRSRYYVEHIDGRQVADPTGDLGRTKRQQAFLSAVMHEVGGTRNPLALRRVSASLVDGLTVDDDLGFFQAIGLLRRMRGLDPAPAELPVRNFTTSAGAQVLLLVEPDADEILRQFGSTGATLG